jgi:large subunit ribosomal protein L15
VSLLQPNDLRASGVELVLAHTMYAIVGAVSLEKGGVVATKVARERILEPLGLKSVS